MPTYSDGRETYERVGLAIINPYGGVWTDSLFESPEKAAAYLKQHYPQGDRTQFKLASARLTVEVTRPVGEPAYIALPST